MTTILRLLLALVLLVPAAQAKEPFRVLVIHSFGRDFAPYNIVASTLRTTLTQLMRESVALHETSLDVERSNTPEEEQLFLDYLVRRNRGVPPDLVIAIANPAMLFCLRYREQLFPGSPLLVTGLDRRRLETVRLPATDRAVTVTLDFPAVARTVLELKPETSTLALVVGGSELEQFWGRAIERELAPLAGRLRVLPADKLSLDEMRQRVATLPPDSAVFYYMYAVGTKGALHEDERALPAIRESSNAPVYGIFTDQLGRGIVGGPLVDSRNMGVVTAQLAARMLTGESTGDKVEVPMPVPAPIFDWRELQRWGIPESRLPPGAVVQFRSPSMWEQNRDMIVAGVALFVLQTVLIASLLVQRRRRRRAEGAALNLSGRLLTAHEDERRRLARELHDDLTQRLARLAIDAGKLERTAGAEAADMRKDLVRLSEDVHAMSYRLHPSVLDDLGLVEALRAECARVERRGGLRVEVDAKGMPDAVSNEISLCLFRIAQEALSNAVRHARPSAVTVLLAPRDRGLQLAVSDNGSGFDPERARERASLGLASMRERVQLDNTLFIYIAGDNGTSAEGGFVGMYNEMTYFNGVEEKVEDLIPLIDKWGGPETFPHMAAGWAVAFDSPFSWTKQVASDFGGTRNGVVVHWPKGIKEKGGLRSQFSHVIDVAPTILEAAGLPQPKSVNGTVQTPIEGTSLVYAFNNAKAPERHTTQYFEMFGNRGIYSNGWFARTIHRAPWQTSNLPPLTTDVWDLYDTRSDFSLTKNLASAQPVKLKEMQALFMKEAQKYHVLPIDDRTIERMNPALAGRPDVLGTRTSLTLYEGMQGMMENTFMNIKNRSSKITAELDIPSGGANGAILSQGGKFGGWSLFMKDGKPAYTYNFLGLARYTVVAPQALPAGPATVVLDFVYDGGGPGKGGKATLMVNGKAVAEGRVEKTQPNIFSADETADVGIDNQTPVAEGIGVGADTRFTGKINKITLEVK